MEMEEPILAPEIQSNETVFDATLRPKTLGEFIGQEKIKENLSIFIGAAKGRQEPLEHVLLYGNPGLGKTTLAHIIARELGVNIRFTSGPMLERVGDLAAILTNLELGEVLFIDEIHRINKTIEEVLYPAMEESALDIVIGKGPSARTLRMDLPKFTLIGATTRLSLLSAPLRDRFGALYHLDFYEDQEIKEILRRSANLLQVVADSEALQLVAERSRRTPRVANRLLRRLRDYAQVKSNGILNLENAREGLRLLDIDKFGLDRVDRELLEAIMKKFNGGPVGLGTLAAATREEISTIEEIYEPFLMQIGFLHRTPRGRVATEAAYRHFNLPLPKDFQNRLI